MRTLLTLFAILFIAMAFLLVLKRRVARHRPQLLEPDDSRAFPQSSTGQAAGWTRQDRLALASLILGTLVGILALLK